MRTGTLSYEQAREFLHHFGLPITPLSATALHAIKTRGPIQQKLV